MNCSLKLLAGGANPLAQSWNGITYYGCCWKLYYMLEPTAWIIARGVRVELNQEHIHLFPPGLTYDTEIKGDPIQLFLHFEAGDPFTHVAQQVYSIPIDPLVRSVLDQTVDEMQPIPFSLGDEGSMNGMTLISMALSRFPKESLYADPMDERVEKAIELLGQKHEPVRIDDVASAVGMSSGAFSRLFKREMGVSPYDHHLQLRITWASELLKNSDLQVDMIAHRTGFVDSYHFSKTFKKMVGIPPAAYRRQHA